MAQVPYDPVQDVGPRPAAPSSYFSVQPTAFEGMQQFGASLAKTSDFFDQAAIDDAYNKLQQHGTGLQYGSSEPGGAPGYMGLQGRAALDARPQVETSIDDYITSLTDELHSPTAKRAFTQRAQAYRAGFFNQVGAHSQSEATTWYGQVNDATISNQLSVLATNTSFDPSTFASATENMIQAYVKKAQLQGAVPGDELYTAAVQTAKQQALTEQINAIATVNPSLALDVLSANKATAGTNYDNLYNALRDKADSKIAQQVGDIALGDANSTYAASYANPAQPVFTQAATSVPGGMSASGLARTVQIESGGDPTAANASDHVGLGQFSQSTAKEVGITDRTNPEQSIYGIAAYAAKNARTLGAVLGRAPTDAELYLAHQQGPGGAKKLLMFPDARAIDLLGESAVLGNLPSSLRDQAINWTARQFTEYWTHKFEGTTPADINLQPTAPTPEVTPAPIGGMSVPAGGIPASVPPMSDTGPEVPEAAPTFTEGAATDQNAPTGRYEPTDQSPKALAYQRILDDTTLTPEQRQKALAYVNQQVAAQQIADDANATARKKASDTAAESYAQMMLSPGADFQKIAAAVREDPRLEWNTKLSLTNAMQADATTSLTGATLAYGPAFYTTLKQITAPAGDPSRLADPDAIWARIGTGLTLSGAQSLVSILGQSQRNANDAATNTTLSSLLTYAHNKLSYNGELLIPGVPQSIAHDPEGEMIYNRDFVPKFMAAYDEHLKKGGSPWDFLTNETVDKLANGLRDPRELARAKLAASVQTGGALDITTTAPEGVDQKTWQAVLAAPPFTDQGNWTPEMWSGAISALQADPSPENIAAFNDYFGPAGYDAQRILDILGGKTSAMKSEFVPANPAAAIPLLGSIINAIPGQGARVEARSNVVAPGAP